jgi:hypothetical protein
VAAAGKPLASAAWIRGHPFWDPSSADQTFCMIADKGAANTTDPA